MSDIRRFLQVNTVSRDAREVREAPVAVEAEVQLSVNGEAWLSFHCSPDGLEELAAGFLYNGGFIQGADEIASLEVCGNRQNIDVWLRHAARKPEQWSRTTGCQGGVVEAGASAGMARLEAQPKTLSSLLVLVDGFLSMLAQDDRSQRGLHTSRLFDGETPLLTSSDLGRHNTFDKIAGRCVLDGLRPVDPVLITTGRISSEMVLKAARMRIAWVGSLHSTSSVAVQAAQEAGITLIGHARRGQVDVYTHPERILS